jgi:hypothetical protein
MSEQTMARFKTKARPWKPANAVQSSFDNEARTPLIILLAVTGTVLLIAVRQHRQPAARARRRPRAEMACACRSARTGGS